MKRFVFSSKMSYQMALRIFSSVIVLTTPIVRKHLDIFSKMFMLEYKSSERSGLHDSEPVWPQLNKRGKLGQNHIGLSKCSL